MNFVRTSAIFEKRPASTFRHVDHSGDAEMKPEARLSQLDVLLMPIDAARLLRVSLSWLAKARLSGDGPRFVKIGRSVRYPETYVREYIRARTRCSTSER
jgi:predicted DNA-binding transcriptional regulator AlpA